MRMELTMEMPQVEIAETAVKNAVVKSVVSPVAWRSESGADWWRLPPVKEVDDGQPSRSAVSRCMRDRVLRGLRSSAMAFLEGVSREPPGVASMRGLTVGGEDSSKTSSTCIPLLRHVYESSFHQLL